MNSNTSASAGSFWLTLTLVNAGLAQAKGRSGFNWWVLSLFLGPIATLLIVVFKALPKAAPDTH
jgi:hypothetical protein